MLTGEHERHVHRRAEEGGDAGQRAGQQAEPDSRLAKRDERPEPVLGAHVDQQLDEPAIPVVSDRRLAGASGIATTRSQ